MEEVQMKRTIRLIPLFALILAVTPAMAKIVAVDFSVLGDANIDITVGNNPEGWTGYTMPDGITFLYDDLDQDGEFALLSAAGIFGTPGHALDFNFSPTHYLGLATGLSVEYALLGLPYNPESPDTVPSALFALFDSGEVASSDAAFIPDTFDEFDRPTFGNAFGRLDYRGRGFGRASLLFEPSGLFFDVSSVSYEPVPEPGALALLASGLAALGGWRRYIHSH